MFNFDEIIDRKDTNALSVDGFRQYIFNADNSMTLPYQDDELIRMWVADMEFATPQVIIDAIKERLDKRIFGYTRIYSDTYYQAFANWCTKKYAWQFPKEQLVTANGIVPALYELVDHICAPDEQLIFLTPSYAPFKRAAEYNNRGSICSDLINDRGHYRIDFADFAQKTADEKTKLFILCNPHNPTGRVWTEEELRQLGEICIKNGVWIISDEIHCDLLRLGKRHIPMAKLFPDYDQIITGMAPSKTFNLAGLMLSNIIIPNQELREKWLARHHSFENPLSVAGVQAAYEKGGPWLEALRAYLDQNFAFAKEYLATHLPQAVFEIAEATYLAWIDLNAYFDQEENLALYFAEKAGVILEGGNLFVQNGDGFIRLNFACPQAVMAAGLEKIVAAIHAKPR